MGSDNELINLNLFQNLFCFNMTNRLGGENDDKFINLHINLRRVVVNVDMACSRN